MRARVHARVLQLCVLPIVLVALGCGPSSRAKQPANDVGQRVLESTLATYRSLSTYEDDGVVVTTYLSDSSPRAHAKLISFRTRFVKPQSFRFGYIDASNQDAASAGFVLATPSGAWTRLDGDEAIETDDSAEAAVSALTGVTSGSVQIIWSLLAGRNPWQCDADPYLVFAVGREPLADAHCLKLRLESPRCDAVEICVDEKTHLVRRVAERSHLPALSASARRERLDELLKKAPPELHESIRKTVLERGDRDVYTERVIYFGPRTGHAIPPEQFRPPKAATGERSDPR